MSSNTGSESFDQPTESRDTAESTLQINLSDEDAVVTSSLEEIPETKPYDPSEDREKVRGRIAQILVWLLVGIVSLSLAVVLIGPAGVADLKLVLELVLTPIVGLVGAVTGFYFGEKTSRG